MKGIEWVRTINEKLLDDESKRIFASRVLYSYTGDINYLYALGTYFKNQVLRSEEWLSFINKLKNENTDLVIYGAGAYGKKIIEAAKDIKFKAVIDGNPINKDLNGIQVINTNDFLKNYDGEAIVIPSKRYFEEMKKLLIENGIEETKIIDGTVLYNLTEGKQYFDLKELPHIQGQEVFADIGSCDGMSSVQFMEWCNRNGTCYCFEPDSNNEKLLQKNMAEKGLKEGVDFSVICRGAWDEETSLSFVSTGTGSSHIAGVYGEAEQEVETLQVTTIDNELKDKNVTFIKMDIEGAELKALHGAEEVIKEFKPKLAICVYHKAEDIWEIPEYILKVRPDYKFYIRHYSFEASETVLYAI